MRIERIPTPARTRAHEGETSAYVLGSDESLLVDPASLTDELRAAIEDRSTAHVAVTHHHPDHVGGLADAVREYDLTVWAHARWTDEFTDAAGIEPDRTFSGTTTLPVADGVDVVETPGHAPEHVAFDVQDGMVVGDLAVAEGSVVVGAPEGDVADYLDSLRWVADRDPRLLYPGHGPVIEDPQAVCHRLVEHRLDRERAVLAAVEAGAETADEILADAYEKDISHVRDLARATVTAHLEKLAAEDQLEWDGERARPTG